MAKKTDVDFWWTSIKIVRFLELYWCWRQFHWQQSLLFQKDSILWTCWQTFFTEILSSFHINIYRMSKCAHISKYPKTQLYNISLELFFLYLIFLHCNTSEEKRRFAEKLWLGSHYRLVFIVSVCTSIRLVSHLIFSKHFAENIMPDLLSY